MAKNNRDYALKPPPPNIKKHNEVIKRYWRLVRYKQAKKGMKDCSVCKIEKPLTHDFFYKRNRSPDGFTPECRDCKKKMDIASRLANPQKFIIRQGDARRERHKNGFCGYCVKPLMENSNQFCEDHYWGNMAKSVLGQYKKWRGLKDKFYAQGGGLCAYTGEKLILGLNVSCDHIKPVSKYPELRSDINNIQFITRDVNSMKRDFEHEVFIQMIKNILNYVETGVGVAPPELIGKSKIAPLKNNQLPLFPKKVDRRSKSYKQTIRHSSF